MHLNRRHYYYLFVVSDNIFLLFIDRIFSKSIAKTLKPHRKAVRRIPRVFSYILSVTFGHFPILTLFALIKTYEQF